MDHFGKSVENFNEESLLKLLENKKNDEAKVYVLTYFARLRLQTCVAFWDHANKNVKILKYDEFMATIIDGFEMVTIEGKKVVTLKVNAWFLKQNMTSYEFGMDLTKPLTYTKDGKKCINLFQGFQHADSERKEPTEEEQKGIDMYWKHVKEVLCSDNEKSFIYFKKWICKMLMGNKMKTALYLKSKQGSGKGIIVRFLMDKVVGKKNSYYAGTNKCIIGDFNGELQGKTLLFLDEMSCKSSTEWLQASNVLKSMITEPDLEMRIKNKTNFNCENFLSIIIVSNHNVVQLEDSDRRYACLDVNNDKMGDTEYFKELGKYTEMDNFANVFYWDCIKYGEQMGVFNEQSELYGLETYSKKTNIINNLHPFYKYLKDNYLLKRKDMDKFLKELTDEYNQNPKLADLKNTEIAEKMRDIKLKGVTSTGNRLRFKFTAEQIYKAFNDMKWIHELDEFEEIEEPKNEDMELSDYARVMIKNKDFEIEQLKKQIEELKKSNIKVETEIEKPIIQEKKKVIRKVTKKVMKKDDKTYEETIDIAIDDLMN